MLSYWPNPAHKRQTTEAGPPRWSPAKEPCPHDLTVAERDELLGSAVPMRADDPTSRRFAMRRTMLGLEFFAIKHTRSVGDDHEFHGHPATWVPTRILRDFRDSGRISQAEYRELAQGFGCPP